MKFHYEIKNSGAIVAVCGANHGFNYKETSARTKHMWYGKNLFGVPYYEIGFNTIDFEISNYRRRKFDKAYALLHQVIYQN